MNLTGVFSGKEVSDAGGGGGMPKFENNKRFL